MRMTHTLSLLLTMLGALQAAASTIVWDNAEGNRVWDVGKTANWNTGGSPPEATVFQQYDYVEFRGDGAGEVVLSPAGDVKDIHAYDITVYGSGDYTFTAANDFSNLHIHGSLNKGGSGKLTIQTPNTHVDGTVNLGGGTLEVADYVTGFSGKDIQFTDSATLLAHGRELQNISINQRAEAVIDTATISSLSGTGTLVKVSDGTLMLAGSNSVDHITLKQGTLVAQNDRIFDDSYNELKLEGGTLDLSGFACASKVELVSDNTATILNGALTNEIWGNGGFTKEGDGTLTIGYFDDFSTYNHYFGDTVVNGGTLCAAADNAFGSEGVVIMNAGTLNLASHRANNTMVARGDASLLADGGRMGSVAVDAHELTIGGNVEAKDILMHESMVPTGLNLQGGGEVKLQNGASITLGHEERDDTTGKPTWEKRDVLAVLGGAEQALLHNVNAYGEEPSKAVLYGQSAELSFVDHLDFRSERGIMLSNLTVGSDCSFTAGSPDAITLWEVTIEISDAFKQLSATEYYFDLTGLFHCDLDMQDVYLDATDLNLNLADATVTLDFGEQVNITNTDRLRLGMKGYDTELTTAQGGMLTFKATVQTPEPATGTMCLLAFLALGARRRR